MTVSAVVMAFVPMVTGVVEADISGTAGSMVDTLGYTTESIGVAGVLKSVDCHCEVEPLFQNTVECITVHIELGYIFSLMARPM